MASPRTRRNEWTRNMHGGWTRSFGQRGMRVRLFQNRRNGVFYRAVWEPGAGRDVESLGTNDRSEAEQLGRLLLAEQLRGAEVRLREHVTLGELWDRYQQVAPSFLDAVASTKCDTKSRADILLGYFGEEYDVSGLTEHEVKVYTRKRLGGGINTAKGRQTQPVRARSAQADLDLLGTMLRWATTVRLPTGERWLKDNPLYGIRRIREPNPLRPVATWERFLKTRQAMQELALAARTDHERLRWLKMELALVLAEATGRRLGAIRQLRWDDFDFDKSTLRWRAEADKKRRESVIPLPESLLNEIKGFQRKLGTIAGSVFARESDGKEPMDRHLFDRWLAVAEKHAELPKLKGGLWHPYRRKWATERKSLSLKDVAAAGGWKDINTLLQCYQQPDQDALLAVMSEPRKVSERAICR